VGAAALGLALLLAAAPGRSEVRRLEAVGAVPVDSARLRGRAPRDAAILEAQREAVSRVANELLIDAELPEGFEGKLVDVLGSDMVRYTTRFRILEDQGVRPALFADDSGATSEYVLVVEVHVDLDRVKARLEEAGWLVPGDGVVPDRRLTIEVRGLRGFEAYQALKIALLEGAGASSVVPAEFERGRVLLEVESEYAAEEFLERLLAGLPPGLRVIPMRMRADRLQLRISWTPPSGDQERAAEGEDPWDSPGSEGSGQPENAAPRN
jgi:hypothetical protein